MEFKLKTLKNVIHVSRVANIHYFEFTNKFFTKQDSHEFCELVYVDSGEIIVEAENYCGVLEKNSLIIHKKGEKHALKCIGNDAPNVIIIGFECNSYLPEQFSTGPVAVSRECAKLLADIIKEGKNVFLPPYDVPNVTDMKKRKDGPFGSEQLLRLKIEEFLIELTRSTENKDAKLFLNHNFSKTADIFAYLTDNFKEEISLNKLCFLFCTNKTTLCNSFKETYGETIVQYVNRLRVRETKKLMREGSLSLTEIARSVGMSSVHYLSRVFKQIEHKSPTEYMRTVKSKFEE